MNRPLLRLLLSGWVGGLLAVGGGSVRADILFVRIDVEVASDGSSWSTAYDDLQAALAVARTGDEIWVAIGVYRPLQADSPDDLRTATFRLRQGVAVYGGFDGTEASRAERAGRFEQTILSGDLNDDDELLDVSTFDPYSPARMENAYHVVTGSGTDATAILDGFTVTAGQADGEFPHDGGAGMLNDSGSPTVANCIFSTNAADFGGGMLIRDGAPQITSCTFDWNVARFSGGGVHNQSAEPGFETCSFTDNTADFGGGMLIRDGAPQITSCTFDRNVARFSGGGVHNQSAEPGFETCSFTDNTADEGGGIASTNVSRLTLMTSTFERNAAVRGGAISSINVSELTLIGCTFEANSAEQGGAIHTLAGSTTTLDACTLVGNSAGSGGAIFNTLRSNATLTGCTLSDNSAGQGGAMLQEGGVATLTNCRIARNVAEVRGGGVWALAARISLFGCRVIDNSAAIGCGILVDSGLSTLNACRLEGNGTALRLISAISTVTNCIFVRNGEAIGSSNHSFATITNGTFFKNAIAVSNSQTGHPTLTNCIVSRSLFEHFGGSSPGNTVVTFSCIEGGWPGDGNLDGDPQFVLAPLAGDDGPEDLRLRPGSPCIDAGDNTGVPEDVTKDLVGNPRRLDDPATPDRGNGSGDQAIVDMGALEFVLPGDSDYDYDADLADYLKLLRCVRRPGAPLGEACRPTDLDLDDDVDLADLILFQAAFTGAR